MPTARLDEDAGERLQRHDVAVEFHVAFTLEDEVNLSELLVVVRTAIGRNIDQVNRRDRVVSGHECPPGFPTRARRGGDFIEVGDPVAGLGGFTRSGHGLFAVEREERGGFWSQDFCSVAG